jgi:hypothetical protein
MDWLRFVGNRVPCRGLVPSARRTFVLSLTRRESRVAFYIRKSVSGKTLWLKRLSPAIVWGPKDQAMTFQSKGAARMVLPNVPKADGAEVVDDDAPDANGG